MSDQDDKSGKHTGGVRHDSRGNAVWQWAVESGKQALESTSRLLKRLEVPGLKLEGDTSEGKQPGAASQSVGRGAGQSAGQSSGRSTGSSAKPGREAGYNPYGASRPAVTRPAALKPTAATKPGAGKPSRPSLWQRLFRGR
jgi:hypothetical protein